MGSEMIIIVLMAFAMVAFFALKKKGNTVSNEQKKVEKVEEKENVVGVKRAPKEIMRKDMSEFIKFDKIANDMIYQKNGQRYTMVIQCKGINYELMSEVEQMAVEEGFITFLNTLKFPIQLYVQTRSIDLNENMSRYKERLQYFNEKSQEVTKKYNDMQDDIDADLEEMEAARKEKIKCANIADYVSDITHYVETLSLNKQMLQRKFYVILSYNKSDLVTTEKFSKQEYEDLCYRELYTRAQGIIGSLMACSITGKILNSNELAQLLYISLNKDDEKTMDIKRAIDSGFYRLYTTSDDVREKRQKMIDEDIMKESMRRIEEAVRDAVRSGIIVPQGAMVDAMDKEIDKTALRTIENSAVSPEVKEVLKKNITDKRRERLKAKKEQEKQMEEAQRESELVEEEPKSELEENQIEKDKASNETIVDDKKEIETNESSDDLITDTNNDDENIVG